MDIVRPKPRQHVPEDAKKVFSGVLYGVYQWEQERFDGSSATYERLEREDSVVIIPVTEQGTILIGREQQPGTDWYLTVPCGGIEPGEAPEAAAKRELLEETGYAPVELDFWFAHQVESRVDWAIFVFIARGCKRVSDQQVDSGERIEVSEVSFDDFLRVATKDEFQNMNIAPKLLKAALDPEEMVALKKRLGLS